jgi:hypothetical protein
VCGGPCGVLVILEIKKKHSTGLSDRLREGKGLKKTRPSWPPQWGVGSLEPNLGNKSLCSFVLIITLRFDSPSPLSLSSSAYNLFELTPVGAKA